MYSLLCNCIHTDLVYATYCMGSPTRRFLQAGGRGQAGPLLSCH